jgi:hypothetical protein
VNDFTRAKTAGSGSEIVREVLAEAFGASATPFVPLPFLDDFLRARLLRRIAAKVLARHGLGSPALPKAIVDAYVKEGASSLGKSIMVGAARFVVRKVAIVLDVKKSYDVFGESIAFALALDLAAENGWVHDRAAARVGGAIHRVLQSVGSGALEALVRAVREAVGRAAGGAGGGAGGDRETVGLGGAIGGEIEKIRLQLEPILRRELPAP